MKTIAFYQFEPLLGDVDANRRRIAAGLQGRRADLIVLPELAFTGYSLKDRRESQLLAEDPADSDSVRLLADLAAGFAEKAFRADGSDTVYNSAVMVGPGGLEAVYRKIHLFGFEADLFDPGDRAPRVYDIGGLKVGIMICFDWFFPETARLLALAGADVIAHPSSLVLDWCQRSMPVRCLENNVYAVTANRYGTEERAGSELTFTGGSQITAPRYEVAAAAPVEGDDYQAVEMDPALARDKNITLRNNLLEDRKAGLYGGLC